MNNITCYIHSNPANVEMAQAWLRGKASIPDIEQNAHILGDIEAFDINGW